MPMFVYISEYFSKCNSKSILKKVYIYLIWQTIYFCTYKFLVKENIEIKALLSPIKIMWYIYALVFWELIILIRPLRKIKFLEDRPILIILISFALSLGCGFIDSIGNDYAVSRVITFFPYFLIGYLQRNKNLNILKAESTWQKNKYKIIIYAIMGILSTIYFIFNINAKNERCLYGAFSYKHMGYDIYFKLMWIFSSLSIMFVLNNIVSSKKIKLISSIGSNTINIYLVHGIIVKIINMHKFKIFIGNEISNIFICFAIALLLVLILGNNYVKKLLLPLTNIDFFINKKKQND